MKKLIPLIYSLLMNLPAFCQKLDLSILTPEVAFLKPSDVDTLVVNQTSSNQEIIIKLKILDVSTDVTLLINDLELNTAVYGQDYSYNIPLPASLRFSPSNNMQNLIRITIIGGSTNPNPIYAELDFKWTNVNDDRKVFNKILPIKITNATNESDSKSRNKILDKTNYLKSEIVQYTDVSGVKNDKPNGLLQFQGILKIPTSKWKKKYANGWTRQLFRSVVIDATINRVDKSKEEIDYNYTNYLYENDKAKKTYNPWLATTDIWRFSNLQIGLRIVPFTFEKGNFRVQLQAGGKLLKNLPFTQDTIRSGVDSGMVKSDFRSVYSNVKFLELYVKTIEIDNQINISLNTGWMWLKLMDSYYQQIDILQQDPFQKAIALSPVTELKKSQGMWFTSFRIGVAIGEEKIVNTFLRLNYTLQKGSYFRPLTNIIDGSPVTFEEKTFYNNFFQLHIGTLFELDKLFEKKDKKLKKDDGPINNSL